MSTQTKTKRILFISCPYNNPPTINLQNASIQITRDRDKQSIPLSTLDHIHILGKTSLTTPLLYACKDNDVPIILSSLQFRLYGVFLPPTPSSTETAIKQVLAKSNQHYSLKLAQGFITDKSLAQFSLLKKKKLISQAEYSYNTHYWLENIQSTSTISQLMGVEGAISKLYFSTLFSNYHWIRRLPRAKEDPMNTLLDIGYSILFNATLSLVNRSSLIPQIGYLHADYYQRPSLVCDIMEPFRYIIDDTLLKWMTYHDVNTTMVQANNTWEFVHKSDYYEFIQRIVERVMETYPDIHEYIETTKQNIMLYDTHSL